MLISSSCQSNRIFLLGVSEGAEDGLTSLQVARSLPGKCSARVTAGSGLTVLLLSPSYVSVDETLLLSGQTGGNPAANFGAVVGPGPQVKLVPPGGPPLGL